MRLKQWGKVFKNTGQEFFALNPFKHSASIAFFTIFSMPGIAMISLYLAGTFYEDQAVREEFLSQIKLIMGNQSAEQIQVYMDNALISSKTVLMKVVGIVTLFLSTTSVFISMQDSINTIWQIKPKPKRAVLNFLINRLLSFAMVASFGFLILVSLLLDTAVTFMQDIIQPFLGDYSSILIWVINIVITLGISFFVFAALFKVLPDARVRWSDVWMGAALTTLLFFGGKYLIGLYLANGDLSDSYGAASSMVALLFWVYYSVMIVLLGAQFTFSYNQVKGKCIRPDKNAVAIEVQELEREDKPPANIGDN